MRLYSGSKLATRDLTIFAMLGAIMFASRFLTELLPPNMHLLGLFIAATTLTFRSRALIPLYVFILLDGVFRGMSFWWLPYLYVWLPLWGAFMLAGRVNLPRKIRAPLYMVICALHGLAFGAMIAPAHALFFGLGLQGMLAWIVAGFPFDILHAVGNFAAATLVLPLAGLFSRLYSRTSG